MSGSNIVSNIAKGKVAYYAGLTGGANDALIAILLKSSGLEGDTTLADYDTLSAMLAAANDEATDASYSRKTLTSVTATVDDTNDRVDLDCADITWTALAGAAIAKLVICYDPDTTTGTDADLIPLTYHSFDVTPDGTDVTATVSNFARCS